MDPISPKLAPPSSPSKIPRRRPSSSSTSSAATSQPLMNLPPSSPTKVAHSIPVSRSNPWQTTVSQSATQSPPESSDQALQDRRRTRTRTRTRSTDISMDSNTTFETSLPSPPPFPSTRKLPPLSIQIPHSPSQQTQPSRTRSISGSTFATKQHNPSTDHSSFTPRSRQPSASHAPTHSQSLRTPRSSHFPHFQPPMSERPRNTSSSHHQHFASPIKVRDSHRERERTSTTTASTSNLATPATYESFDFPLPAETTPSEEREARLCLEKKRRMCCGLGRLFIRGSSSNGENDWRKDVGERTRLLGENIEREVQGKEIGKWEYVWGEVVCYAKHMLPPIFLFVVLVLVVALFAYKQAIRRIIHDRFPPMSEEP